jgi:hypothetical protein
VNISRAMSKTRVKLHGCWLELAYLVCALVLLAATTIVVGCGTAPMGTESLSTETGEVQATATESPSGQDTGSAGGSAGSVSPETVEGQVVFQAAWGEEADHVGLTGGGEKGELRGPASFTIDGETLYVLDGVNRRVLIVKEGKVINAVAIDEASDPTDLAVAADGTVIVDDSQGSREVLGYTIDGRLLKTIVPEDLMPAILWREGETVYSLMGVNEQTLQSSYVPIYQEGALQNVAEQLDSALDGCPVQNGAIHVAAENGKVTVSKVGNGETLLSVTLDPTVASPVEFQEQVDGKVVLSFLTESAEQGLQRKAWLVGRSGLERSYDLGPEGIWSYEHVRSRVTADGSVYVMTTDSGGLTIKRFDLS